MSLEATMFRTLAVIAIAVLSAGTASAGAPDEPWLWGRQLIGGGGWPSGAISDTRVQIRTPLHRSDSILFQETFAGIGGRVQLSPAFIDIGPRLSIAPIDAFDLDVQGSWTGYAGPFAPLPMDSLEGRIESARNERSGEGMVMSKWELSLTPTLKAKVGRVIAFDSLQIGFIRANLPAATDSPMWYEPYRDMVLARNDITFENQGAVLFEVLPGEDRPLLWLGGSSRHRQAVKSGDTTHAVGVMAVCKPGVSKLIPTLIAQVHAYVIDEERVGTPPNVQLAAAWTLERPLRRVQDLAR